MVKCWACFFFLFSVSTTNNDNNYLCKCIYTDSFRLFFSETLKTRIRLLWSFGRNGNVARINMFIFYIFSFEHNAKERYIGKEDKR